MIATPYSNLNFSQQCHQNRKELKNCLDYLRDEDTLVVTKLDRLARSNTHLNQIVEGLMAADVNLIVLDQKIDTRSALGKMMYQLLGVFAEFENNIRKERQADGIRIAREKGIKFGRKGTVAKNLNLSMV
ncbi:DNA-invertase hin (plasmid) [Piscirickettsia salmonis]|uniref:recombinase family protein n=1 Tax=Piscirickettsia salmonis TaxID=1238 RepID=UPI0012BA95C4|nr:recombinase family protein [Piscirickettsia salmonis]QGO68426.1 DNA-invertase hin [Piscirickettsia salmonis]